MENHRSDETDFIKEHRASMFGKASHAALLFCIAFAFLVPSLLIWRVVL